MCDTQKEFRFVCMIFSIFFGIVSIVPTLIFYFSWRGVNDKQNYLVQNSDLLPVQAQNSTPVANSPYIFSGSASCSSNTMTPYSSSSTNTNENNAANSSVVSQALFKKTDYQIQTEKTETVTEKDANGNDVTRTETQQEWESQGTQKTQTCQGPTIDIHILNNWTIAIDEIGAFSTGYYNINSNTRYAVYAQLQLSADQTGVGIQKYSSSGKDQWDSITTSGGQKSHLMVTGIHDYQSLTKYWGDKARPLFVLFRTFLIIGLVLFAIALIMYLTDVCLDYMDQEQVFIETKSKRDSKSKSNSSSNSNKRKKRKKSNSSS